MRVGPSSHGCLQQFLGGLLVALVAYIVLRSCRSNIMSPLRRQTRGSAIVNATSGVASISRQRCKSTPRADTTNQTTRSKSQSPSKSMKAAKELPSKSLQSTHVGSPGRKTPSKPNTPKKNPGIQQKIEEKSPTKISRSFKASPVKHAVKSVKERQPVSFLKTDLLERKNTNTSPKKTVAKPLLQNACKTSPIQQRITRGSPASKSASIMSQKISKVSPAKSSCSASKSPSRALKSPIRGVKSSTVAPQSPTKDCQSPTKTRKSSISPLKSLTPTNKSSVKQSTFETPKSGSPLSSRKRAPSSLSESPQSAKIRKWRGKVLIPSMVKKDDDSEENCIALDKKSKEVCEAALKPTEKTSGAPLGVKDDKMVILSELSDQFLRKKWFSLKTRGGFTCLRSAILTPEEIAQEVLQKTMIDTAQNQDANFFTTKLMFRLSSKLPPARSRPSCEELVDLVKSKQNQKNTDSSKDVKGESTAIRVKVEKRSFSDTMSEATNPPKIGKNSASSIKLVRRMSVTSQQPVGNLTKKQEREIALRQLKNLRNL